MIILKVGHKKVKLQNLEDAEIILRILGNAKSVDSRYLAEHGEVWFEDSDTEISINIVGQQLTPYDEYKKLLGENK